MLASTLLMRLIEMAHIVIDVTGCGLIKVFLITLSTQLYARSVTLSVIRNLPIKTGVELKIAVALSVLGNHHQ
jgi:hypothetical protein